MSQSQAPNKVTYNPKSFGSIMRAIYTLLLNELDSNDPGHRAVLHRRHVKLRRRIDAAYGAQFGGKPNPHAVGLEDIALMCLRRVEGGAAITELLTISRGKMIKLARKSSAK